MTGTPEELRDRMHALEAEGVRQVAFIPTASGTAAFAREFADQLIARY